MSRKNIFAFANIFLIAFSERKSQKIATQLYCSFSEKILELEKPNFKTNYVSFICNKFEKFSQDFIINFMTTCVDFLEICKMTNQIKK